MANTKKTQQHDNLEDIESALTRTEQFIEDHQYKIFYAIGAIVLIVVGYLAFTRFYIAPREKEAQAQMFRAEQYFAKDSFNLALNGDGNYLGFLDIIDTYSSTEPGSLARYYAGVSYLNLGQYQEAIDQLGKFDTDDLILGPVSQGAIGDAYLELGNQDKALKQYEKAIALSENELTAPVYMMKAAALLEGMNQPEKALKYYQEIKTKFAATAEGRNADKYIARVNASLVK